MNSQHFDALHFVYRVYDTHGLLLYIGCTSNPRQRLATHRSQAPWSRYAETHGVWGPFDREHALHLERVAIDTEGSYFNSTAANRDAMARNRHAADAALVLTGVRRRDTDGSDAAENAEADRWQSVRRAKQQAMRELFPFVDDADRMAAYLAARAAAEAERMGAAS